jgi:hypothetical protein
MTFLKTENGKDTTMRLRDPAAAYDLALHVFSRNETAATIEVILQVNEGYRVAVKDKTGRIIFQLKTI